MHKTEKLQIQNLQVYNSNQHKCLMFPVTTATEMPCRHTAELPLLYYLSSPIWSRYRGDYWHTPHPSHSSDPANRKQIWNCLLQERGRVGGRREWEIQREKKRGNEGRMEENKSFPSAPWYSIKHGFPVSICGSDSVITQSMAHGGNCNALPCQGFSTAQGWLEADSL